MKIETVSYQINWQKFKPGRSFFVPCVDTKAAKAEVTRVTKRLKIPIVMKVVIEDGVMGLRVWHD